MNRRQGITDWPAKQAFLRSIYDVLNNKSLVQNIVEGWVTNRDILIEEVERCYETFRRWRASKPSNERSRRFWQQVIEDKDLENIGVNKLITSSITEFVHFFRKDPQMKTAISELLADSSSELKRETAEALKEKYLNQAANGYLEYDEGHELDVYNLTGHLAMNFEGHLTGIESGRIQSTMFYNVPEAAKAWEKLVDSENYGMYLECLLSLKKLLSGNAWRTSIEDASLAYRSAVMLGGGGSPEKDWELATGILNLLEDNERIEYRMNDISPFMIQYSAKFLHRRLVKQKMNDRVSMRYDWSDFLELDMHFNRPQSNGVVWALLGGTIGNVSERNFFRSLNGPSQKDDLLIIGIDTHDDEDIEEFEKRMSSEYRCKELDALLAVPFTNEANEDQPIVEVKIDTYKKHGISNLSDIPNSRTAVFYSDSPGANSCKCVLAHSTRYDVSEFLNFAERLHWKCVDSASASDKSTFKQLLLRKIN
jgi:hypothetical protein